MQMGRVAYKNEKTITDVKKRRQSEEKERVNIKKLHYINV